MELNVRATEVGVELAQRHQPGGRAVAPAGERVQPLGDLVQLRHVVGRQRQGGLGREELRVRVLLVLRRELGRDQAPDALLLVGVVDRRHRLAGPVRERGRGDLPAAGAVGGIREAGVVLPQVHLHLTVGVGRHGRVELSLLEHRAHLLVSGRGLVGLSPHGSTDLRTMEPLACRVGNERTVSPPHAEPGHSAQSRGHGRAGSGSNDRPAGQVGKLWRGTGHRHQ